MHRPQRIQEPHFHYENRQHWSLWIHQIDLLKLFLPLSDVRVHVIQLFPLVNFILLYRRQCHLYFIGNGLLCDHVLLYRLLLTRFELLVFSIDLRNVGFDNSGIVDGRYFRVDWFKFTDVVVDFCFEPYFQLIAFFFAGGGFVLDGLKMNWMMHG